MDIGIIILIIIASLIGNIFKQPKRKGEGRRNQNNNTPKIEWPTFSPFGPEGPNLPGTEGGRQRIQQQKPVFRKIPETYIEPLKSNEEEKESYMDLLTTLESRRADIGSTYENQDIPASSLETSVNETTSAEYGAADKREVVLQDRGAKASRGSDDLELNFNEESLIRGIIMAEVLSPPKCRR